MRTPLAVVADGTGLVRILLASACATALAITAAGPAEAAERVLRGEATFKAPAEAVIARLPAGSPIPIADLRSGTLSFEIVYDDAAPDAEPDAYGGRYPTAIRGYRVRIGSTTLELPSTGTELRVSDGGFGLTYRESVQLLATARHGDHDLRVGWVQINQRASTEDLRGPAGAIAGDAIPDPRTLVAFPTSGEFDRVFFVRLDPVTDPRRPALYLSTSTMTVAPATLGSR
ncbi:MAG: hypothetical protein ACOYLX_07860 [Burkholderiaceae bacterium]